MLYVFSIEPLIDYLPIKKQFNGSPTFSAKGYKRSTRLRLAIVGWRPKYPARRGNLMCEGECHDKFYVCT